MPHQRNRGLLRPVLIADLRRLDDKSACLILTLKRLKEGSPSTNPYKAISGLISRSNIEPSSSF